MLKRFLLNALSSFVGTCIAFGLIVFSCFLLLFAIAGNMALQAGSSSESVKSRSILRISLDGVIAEREMAAEPDIMSVIQGDLQAPQTLDVIVESIKEAAKNDDIVAIYLDCGLVSAGGATLNAIRNELVDFKKATDGKKKIVAYADMFSQGSYFVASVADEIYLNPAGMMELKGLSGTTLYYKTLLDKLGVKMQVVKVGTYKSAVEPYLLTDMSEPARAQMDTMLGTMWNYLREQIAESRKGVTPPMIDSLVSREFISLQKAERAVKAGLVDSLYYGRQIKRRLADLSGREIEKLNLVSPNTLISQTPWSQEYNSNKQIAVLFASGEIADGNSNQINYEDLVPVIVKLADNDKVKGMVLRVNSPGGSVFGSDQIGEALDYFQSKGKPLAVSMGDYAASGGYWISACADRIFADPLTITGSIGIFGVMPDISGTLDKIGVNVATVSTNPAANIAAPLKPLTPEQLAEFQKYVDRGYDDFTSRVAKGRHLKKEQVLHIAEGRVWAAPTALEIGLVDELGYLQNAIEWTAAKAGVEKDYKIAAYPEVNPTFWGMMRTNAMSGMMTMAELKIASDTRNDEVLRNWLLARILWRSRVLAMMPEMRVNL